MFASFVGVPYRLQAVIFPQSVERNVRDTNKTRAWRNARDSTPLTYKSEEKEGHLAV